MRNSFKGSVGEPVSFYETLYFQDCRFPPPVWWFLAAMGHATSTPLIHKAYHKELFYVNIHLPPVKSP